MTDRITPEHITSLQPDQVFCFGSNLAGIHGSGAAKLAYERFGARWGKGFGPGGQTYAIPTKDRQVQALPLEDIEPYVQGFLLAAKSQPDLQFLVTPIGCGLAGYAPEQIAPLFKDAVDMPNIALPQSFWNVLNPQLV